MPETNIKTRRLANFALVEGYLRENGLQLKKDRNQKDCISGTVTVAIDQFNSQRVSVYVSCKRKRDGKEEDNPDFKLAQGLLPQNTITMTDKLAADSEGADIDNLSTEEWTKLASECSKVWFSGTYEEFYSYEEDDKGKGTERSSYSVHAHRGAVRTAAVKRPFKPGATVQIDGRITGMKDEIKDDKETGRELLKLVWINFKGEGQVFDLVAPVSLQYTDEEGKLHTLEVADHIKDAYEPGYTAKLNFRIDNIVTKTTKKENVGWGVQTTSSTTTTFNRELVIIGAREPKGVTEDDTDEAITRKEVEDALNKRLENGKQNAKASAERRKNSEGKSDTKNFGAGFPSTSSTSTTTAAFDASSVPDDF